MGHKSLTNLSRNARVLLELAGSFTDGYFEAFQNPYIGLVGRRKSSFYSKREFQKTLTHLESQKIIEIDRRSEELSFRFTDRGWIEVFRLQVLSADMLEDDKICMVIFDIPESKRSLRQNIRRFLRQAGFISIQRSVWICPFDASEALVDFFDGIKVSGWIRVYTAIEHKNK